MERNDLIMAVIIAAAVLAFFGGLMYGAYQSDVLKHNERMAIIEKCAAAGKDVNCVVLGK